MFGFLVSGDWRAHLFPLLLHFSVDPQICSHSSALCPRDATSQDLPRGLPMPLQLAALGRKFAFFSAWAREGALPSESGGEESCGETLPEWGLGSFFWLMQHTNTALLFVLISCVFRRTCLCPQGLTVTLKWRIKPWNLYPWVFASVTETWHRTEVWLCLEQDSRIFLQRLKFGWNLVAVRCSVLFCEQKYLRKLQKMYLTCGYLESMNPWGFVFLILAKW